jgi:hypothetical protein
MSNVIAFPNLVGSRVEYIMQCHKNQDKIEEFRDSIYLVFKNDVFIKGFYDGRELEIWLKNKGVIYEVNGDSEDFTVKIEDNEVYRIKLNDKSF